MSLAVVAEQGLHLHQVDVRTAFIRSPLEEEIFMKPPPLPDELYQLFDANLWSGKAWKLLKALYGLKQGARAWFKLLHDSLITLGFQASQYTPSLYFRDVNEKRTFLLVYVDDILIASTSKKEIVAIKRELKELFDIRDLGEANLFLGMRIHHDKEKGVVCVH